MIKITDINWLADENIHPGLINHLTNTVHLKKLSDFDLLGKADSSILEFCYKNNFAILTQDADFGKLALHTKMPLFGIIFLRPGHFHINKQLLLVEQIIKLDIYVEPPFIIVASLGFENIRIRVRNNLFEI
jgi:predicted nuclease of predicted toxin-antitoxin system